MTSTLGGAEVVHQTLIANWGLHEFSTIVLIEMQTRGGRSRVSGGVGGWVKTQKKASQLKKIKMSKIMF